MKIRVVLFITLLLFVCSALLVGLLSYSRSSDEVMGYGVCSFKYISPAAPFVVVPGELIGCKMTPYEAIASIPNLNARNGMNTKHFWKVIPPRECIIHPTQRLKIPVNLHIGQLCIESQNYTKLLSTSTSERNETTSAIFKGGRFYKPLVTYPIYAVVPVSGFGQYQEGVVKNKYRQLNFLQKATQVAVSFLNLKRHSGFLLGNFSVTAASNLWPFHQILTWQPLLKNGKIRWLSTS